MTYDAREDMVAVVLCDNNVDGKYSRYLVVLDEDEADSGMTVLERPSV
jgi:hypothetical protein